MADQLQGLLYDELNSQTDTSAAERDFNIAIDRVVAKLSRLSCQHSSFDDETGWLGLNGLQAMLRRGVDWKIKILGSDRDALAIMDGAVVQAERMARRAVLHGDIHLRNVLVRDKREPHLIDYALSGKGHPCFDLVRFESALMFQCFRPIGDEQAIAELVMEIVSSARSAAEISNRFSQLMTSCGNRLALRAAVQCRDASLDVLRQQGGGLPDYLAVRYIVACQSLTVPDLQTGVVRATVAALASMLDD
ncbi:MAG: aminoglycoside phosphotransferase family protein [Planctomycetes bacterium]|nr:aminoglycoside phosphotransferase family protein [Planctomycetota bacterium]